jgi:hypothetical protein
LTKRKIINTVNKINYLRRFPLYAKINGNILVVYSEYNDKVLNKILFDEIKDELCILVNKLDK